MVCLITRPAPQTLFNQYRGMFEATVLGGSPVIPESNEWYVVAMNYAMAEEFYAISEQQWRERDPRYACCDNLVSMAARDGVYPKSATYAQGYAIITGTAGARLPRRFEVLASNGRTYVTASTPPTFMPSTGSLTVRIRDQNAGPEGNASNVATGTLLVAPTGVNTAVTICGGILCGGAAAETCEELRTRYITRRQYQPRATQAWALSKLLEWPCATRALPRGGSCCETLAAGCDRDTCGTGFDFYVMFDNSFPCGIAPKNILTEIQQWFFGENPGYGEGQVEMGICGNIVEVKPLEMDVALDIVGCPTQSQLSRISDQVKDLFTTLTPSTPLRLRQIELIVANVMGANTNVAARITLVGDNAAAGGTVTACGDIEVNCDYVPCLRNLTFPGANATGTC